MKIIMSDAKGNRSGKIIKRQSDFFEVQVQVKGKGRYSASFTNLLDAEYYLDIFVYKLK